MTYIKFFIGVFAFIGAFHTNLYAQSHVAACCTIIEISKDSGVVVIRDSHHAWIKNFKPDPLAFAALKVGDSVDASARLQQVNRIKGQAVSYPLIQPYFTQSCCEIQQILRGKNMFTVSAKNVNGESLRFQVPDNFASRLTPANKVYTSTHGFAMMQMPAEDSSAVLYYGFPMLQIVGQQ